MSGCCKCFRRAMLRRNVFNSAERFLPADIFARYHRLKGNRVLMVSGTDEHGTPVMVSADREGVSPREIADRYNQLIREDLRDLGSAAARIIIEALGGSLELTGEAQCRFYFRERSICRVEKATVLARPATCAPLGDVEYNTI